MTAGSLPWRLPSAEYGLSVDAVRPLGAGHMCESYLVEAAEEEFVLRLRPAAFGPEHVAADHAFLDYLSEGGFPAPAVVRRASGDSRGRLDDGRAFELLGYLEHDCSGAGRIAAQAAGKVAELLGRYHRLGAVYPRRIDKPERVGRIPVRPGDKYFRGPLGRGIEDYRRPGVPAELVNSLRRRLEGLADRRRALRFTPQVVAHNDFYGENLLFAGGRPVGIIDFDFCLTGSHLIDVVEWVYAAAVHDPDAETFWGLNPDRGIDPAVVGRVLAAYEKRSGLRCCRPLLADMLQVKVISLVFYPGFTLADSAPAMAETLRRARCVLRQLARLDLPRL